MCETVSTPVSKMLAIPTARDFYEQIEEPIRGLVCRLRDSGINTIASCGHEMWVQADVIPSEYLQIMHKVTYDWLVEQGKRVNYTIDIHLEAIEGHWRCFAEIKIKEDE